MKAATCKQCGRHAMVPVDANEAEEALTHADFGWPMSCRLECAYCGGQQSTRDAEEIRHAFCEDDIIRTRAHLELKREREKVARLQEGRW